MSGVLSFAWLSLGIVPLAFSVVYLWLELMALASLALGRFRWWRFRGFRYGTPRGPIRFAFVASAVWTIVAFLLVNSILKLPW